MIQYIQKKREQNHGYHHQHTKRLLIKLAVVMLDKRFLGKASRIIIDKIRSEIGMKKGKKLMYMIL